jgi:uncharacterized membrane protein YgdD (TMEM256/DUF423 family)
VGVQTLLALAAFAGFSGVALGAFGAHGLRRRFDRAPDGAKRLEWWQTGANYHLLHALAIGLSALVVERVPSSLPVAAGWAFASGILLFSGSLYVMTLTGARRLGAVTPLGGLAFLVGWGCLLGAAFV